jgi:hypothetical protein
MLLRVDGCADILAREYTGIDFLDKTVEEAGPFFRSQGEAGVLVLDLAELRLSAQAPCDGEKESQCCRGRW